MKTSYLFVAALLISCGSNQPDNLVTPLEPTKEYKTLNEITLPAAFMRSDFDWEKQTLTLQPHAMDQYDADRIARLQAGDRLLFDGDTLTVERVEFDGSEVIVNSGIEEGGATLRLEPNGYWRGLLWNDHATYTEMECVTLPFAPQWLLSDCGEAPTDPQIELREGQQEYLNQLADYRETFSPLNTTIQLQNGYIVAIHRRWIP